jgi:hypothetical protein
MNYALAVLLTLVIIFIIIFITLVGRMYYLATKIVPPVVIFPSVDTSCSPSIDNLIDVSNIPNCTNQSLSLLGSKYIPSLNMIVGLTQIPFISACSSACITGLNQNTLKCINSTYQDDFDRCVSITLPNGCSSLSTPVAYSGNDYYYINYYGPGNCLS